MVKGIMRLDDATTAAYLGVDGVVLSNHGGRQLDGMLSPLRVLPEIAASIRDRVVVMMDGGVRRGTDVLKAMVLGAKFVFAGRPLCNAATGGGLPGAMKAAEILQAETAGDMALLGIASLDRQLEDSWMTPQFVSWTQALTVRCKRHGRHA